MIRESFQYHYQALSHKPEQLGAITTDVLKSFELNKGGSR